MTELLLNICKRLYRKRLRTLLTVVGISVGTLLITVVTVLGESGQAVLNTELKSMGLDGISVSADRAEAMSLDTLQNIRNLNMVQAAMPLSVQFSNAQIGLYDGEIMACGIDAGAQQVISLQPIHGSLLTVGDVKGEKNVCVVDEQLARKAYGRDNIVGKTLVVQYGDVRQSFTVVGVSETGSSVLQNVTGYVPLMVYFPYTTLRNLTFKDTFDQIAVKVEEDENVESVKTVLGRVLRNTDTVSADFHLENLATQREKLNRLMQLVKLVLQVISAVSLLVAGISIMTIMLSSVKERTKEIGIKKAIGASNRCILTEFMAEGLLVTGIGAAVGMVPIAATVWSMITFADLPLIFPLKTLCGIFLLTLLLGLFFSVYPARKAALLPPVEALRSNE